MSVLVFLFSVWGQFDFRFDFGVPYEVSKNWFCTNIKLNSDWILTFWAWFVDLLFALFTQINAWLTCKYQPTCMLTKFLALTQIQIMLFFASLQKIFYFCKTISFSMGCFEMGNDSNKQYGWNMNIIDPHLRRENYINTTSPNNLSSKTLRRRKIPK